MASPASGEAAQEGAREDFELWILYMRRSVRPAASIQSSHLSLLRVEIRVAGRDGVTKKKMVTTGTPAGSDPFRCSPIQVTACDSLHTSHMWRLRVEMRVAAPHKKNDDNGKGRRVGSVPLLADSPKCNQSGVNCNAVATRSFAIGAGELTLVDVTSVTVMAAFSLRAR